MEFFQFFADQKKNGVLPIFADQKKKMEFFHLILLLGWTLLSEATYLVLVNMRRNDTNRHETYVHVLLFIWK